MLALPFVLGTLATRALVAEAASAVASALQLPTAAPARLSSPMPPMPPMPAGARAGSSNALEAPGFANADADPVPHGAAVLVRASVPAGPSELASGLAATGASPRDGDAPEAKEGGAIVVPASAVARALEKRDVGATNATAPDGSAIGVRLVNVSRYRAGLRDGDVVIAVAGTKTPDVATVVAVGMQAASSGAARISGRILRSGVFFNVVLELPK